ncbi:MAG: DUF3341 domain-containing protein, partial [Ignavibacteria bacterium]|nr:DUF3341 domain-containing protein [Ignavibacteria bacterium]
MISGILNKLKSSSDKFLETEPRSDKLFALGALFDKPDEIIHAAEEVSENYKKFDVLTPYPVHGMDRAMKLRETSIGWVGLAAGMSGTLLAFIMIWWMVGVDYRNIFGGKPYFNIPPSIPIMFEVTVLLASLTLVGSLIAIFSKLPANANPLMDTEFLKRCTSDSFGIYIESSDSKFNTEEIRSLFRSLGAREIHEIYFPVYDKGDTENPILNFRFTGGLVLIGIITAGITYFILNVLLFLPPFDWMHEQPRVNPQTPSTFFKDGWSMRKPVEGTVARGFIPYEFKGKHDSLVIPSANPLPLTKEVMDKGKKRYDTYCSPCHGYYGKGDSRLRGQFPVPPTLHSEKVRKWSDANIYHVITNGQNVMPSYE